ncbi:cilia- and flagella-associated protein 77 [Kryptolebias marmoratus]|uniref:cilia- and flagella-associated protein 77 n=1 Tax=Kryptolebias marmoratus TaxID=37003 RepID=UPI0007F9278F|nr:cilia- and flagella-associated protein 77 [Kryptolebias marmoratus]
METDQLETGEIEEKLRPTGSMTSPRLGVVRESMLKDPLLIKAPLGRARTRGLAVPGPDFTFGTSSDSLRDGGVAQVLSSWSVQSRHEDTTRPPDFVSLNRNAVRSGLVTAKELNQYRTQVGRTTVQSQASGQRGGGASRQPLALPDITFGVTNRAPSPLADLLSYQYARRWFEDQSRNQTSNQKHQMKPGHIAETRTSLLRRSRSLPVLQTPFSLPQFTQVGPALDTFRDPEARRRALGAHRSNSGTRRGHQGLETI